MLVGLVLFTLVRTSEALADDQTFVGNSAQDPDAGKLRRSSPPATAIMATVSLQAGRHGDPSLQWTSRLMNRGGATLGLLDRVFSVSLARASSGRVRAQRAERTRYEGERLAETKRRAQAIWDASTRVTSQSATDKLVCLPCLGRPSCRWH